MYPWCLANKVLCCSAILKLCCLLVWKLSLYWYATPASSTGFSKANWAWILIESRLWEDWEQAKEWGHHFLFIILLRWERRWAVDIGKGKVCVRAKWPIQPELISVSVALSDWEYCYSPLDGMPVHRRDYPPAVNLPVPIYTPGWREALCESKVSCPRTQRSAPARTRTRAVRLGVERANH